MHLIVIISQVWIVKGIATYGERIDWAATLFGGYVITPQVLLNEGVGPGVKFNQAVRLRRQLWLSDKFVVVHAGTSKAKQEEQPPPQKPNGDTSDTESGHSSDSGNSA